MKCRFIYTPTSLSSKYPKLPEISELQRIGASQSFTEELQKTEEAHALLTSKKSTSDNEGLAQLTSQVEQSIKKRAWNLSWSPIKAIGMNLVMLYFNGGSLSIFTMIIVAYTIYNSIMTLASVTKQYEPLEKNLKDLGQSTASLILPKLVYVLICTILTSYAISKAMGLGILPYKSGDYLFLIPPRISEQTVHISI